MSFQAMAWAVKQKVGNATGKAILLMLANYADERGECYPSQEKLAAECECSVATVARWVKHFEERGILSRHKQYGEGGYRRADRLRLATDLPVTESPSAELPNSEPNLTRQKAGAEPIRDTITSSLRSDDVSLAVQAYTEMADRTGLPKPRVINDARRRKIATTLKAYSLDLWREAVAAIEASSFCRGQNGSGWVASLDFLIQRKSFDGLIEGKYADRQPRGSPSAPPREPRGGDAFFAAAEFVNGRDRNRTGAQGNRPDDEGFPVLLEYDRQQR